MTVKENMSLTYLGGYACHFLYLHEDSLRKQLIEVQFDERKFNGKVLCAREEDGELEWETLEKGELFDAVAELAMHDYDQSNFGPCRS